MGVHHHELALEVADEGNNVGCPERVKDSDGPRRRACSSQT